ncbi:DUF6122 family protein [Gallaecimonas xiamenensis]|uniref:Membrane-bound metal-dependent hydrolase n=1 Tax=Gallaecimonas xiamenensis 3-C-1 TaxID=745411 RepID=K2JDS8_9GAMM|nr:DUF6122 family protein [Gallaecimonas xiamenensis]EKE68684.1 hypothetical protein B3C1_16686 [Gallaecimonas xiamenensis 3-C-1]
MLSSQLHMVLHFLVPLLLALGFWRARWRLATLVMWATMAVDLDHLLATPVFDPLRCSIGFHPLHQGWAIGLYLVLALIPKSRWVGVGLLVHMALDGLDCLKLIG